MGYPTMGYTFKLMSKSIHTSEYKVITKKLRDARESIGFTQTEAADKLGKPQSYVSKIERSERRVDAVELVEFAKLYKKPLEWFVK